MGVLKKLRKILETSSAPLDVWRPALSPDVIRAAVWPHELKYVAALGDRNLGWRRKAPFVPTGDAELTRAKLREVTTSVDH